MGNHPIQNPALNLASDIGKQKKARMLKDAKGCLDNQTLREVLSVLRVDTRVVTTRRVIKVQRHSIFRHLENGRKKAYMCIVRTPKTSL
jgi:hypothetical protein